MRSSTGCWTCRLRRKKCDENTPICAGCDALLITCHYSSDRPKWMDGGLLQAAMAEQVKQDIKLRAPFRLRGSATQHKSTNHSENSNGSSNENAGAFQAFSVDAAGQSGPFANRGASGLPYSAISGSSACKNGGPRINGTSLDRLDSADLSSEDDRQSSQSTEGASSQFGSGSRVGGANYTLTRSDALMATQFIDFVIPFLFPCYELPPVRQGRSWLLEMLLSSPLIRQSATCQSEFFMALTDGVTGHIFEQFGVCEQRTEIFSTMRQALQKLIDSKVLGEHIFGAARVMIGMIQWMHFELAILGSEAWQTHLGTATALFEEILGSIAHNDNSHPATCLRSVFEHLGTYNAGGLLSHVEIPNAEQVGLRFATAVLLFDDIIASTVLGTVPKLEKYHESLLCVVAPVTDMESSVGCRSWVPMHISEISVLSAWKNSSLRDGTFNSSELGHRASSIRTSIEHCLASFEMDDPIPPDNANAFERSICFARSASSSMIREHRPHITQIWARAALLYLHVVVSGWQCSNVEVVHLANQVITLLQGHIKQVTVLRSLMWPLCVAGMLADPVDRAQVWQLLDTLKPASLFPMAAKAKQVLEKMWQQRSTGSDSVHDFATAFRDNDNVLLFL